MSRVVALLAAVLALGLAIAGSGVAVGCGGDGAEPGASSEATLVLDFQPNAVHTGVYTGLARGEYEREGIDLTVREPSASTDGPKLLAAGRTEFAILDIHDLAIARERGIDVVGVGAIVHLPLAAVIAGDRDSVRTPADLAGRSVGVTGLPSDDGVLDSVLAAGGVDPGSVDRVTIGFDSVAALSAGRVDAATAFWNAEGVQLRSLGIPTREFRVSDFGAPPYPELVLATSASTLASRPELVQAMVDATSRGYADALDDPDAALDDLIAAVPALDADQQRDQLQALIDADALRPTADLDPGSLARWSRWEAERGIVARPVDVGSAFELSSSR